MFVIEATCTVAVSNVMTKCRGLVFFCFSCGFVGKSIWIKALAWSKLSLSDLVNVITPIERVFWRFNTQMIFY